MKYEYMHLQEYADIKIIIWGIERYFHCLYYVLPFEIVGVVFEDSKKYGNNEVFGVKVISPEELPGSFSNDSLILIASEDKYDKVKRTANQMGYENVMSALDFVQQIHMNYPKMFYKETVKQVGCQTFDSPLRGKRAVVLHGAVDNDLVSVAAHISKQFKDDIIVLSTWSNTPEATLDEIRPFLHNITLTSFQENGLQRNTTIKCVQTGLKLAKQMGAVRALKLSVGYVVRKSKLLDSLDKLLDEFDHSACQAVGQRMRTVIPDFLTSMNELYKPNSSLMYGDIEDLICYWDLPDDPRSPEEVNRFFLNYAHNAAINLTYPPCYYLIKYLEKLERCQQYTLEDSWKVFRDHFIVMDFSWFDTMLIKAVHQPQTSAVMRHIREFKNGFWWFLYQLTDEQLRCLVDRCTIKRWGNYEYDGSINLTDMVGEMMSQLATRGKYLKEVFPDE